MPNFKAINWVVAICSAIVLAGAVYFARYIGGNPVWDGTDYLVAAAMVAADIMIFAILAGITYYVEL